MKEHYLVTGGTGFLGSEIVRQLEAQGHPVTSIGKRTYDLTDQREVKRLFKEIETPDVVINCAAHVGGIGLNREKPADLFFDNLQIGTLMMHEANRAGVGKFVAIGTVCSYPAFAHIPFQEEDIWNGYPEMTNAAYGLAKRLLMVQARAMRAQYGFDAIVVIPTNLYGPGQDSDLSTSHVIPAIIRKMKDAKESGFNAVELWGSGTATRDFLHVRDAARGIILAAQKYSYAPPINLGGLEEISIVDVAKKIASLMDFIGLVTFDHSKPDGQQRRAVSSERARIELGWMPEITLDVGLKEMIETIGI